jgi:hypothetical protein
MKRRSAWVAMFGVMAWAVAATPAARGEAAEEPAKKTLSGNWSCIQHIPGAPDRSFEFSLVQDGNQVTGRVYVSEGDAAVRGTVDAAGAFTLEVDSDAGTYTVTGKRDSDTLVGTWLLGSVQGSWDGKRKTAS